MRLPVPLRRLAYRCAYVLLRVYWFFVRPPKSGVKCVLTSGEKLLLVRHTYGPRRWDLPGGAIRRGEQPQTAAKREMHEELGVTIDEWTALGELRGRQDHRRDTLHCFQAELDDRPLTLDPGEIAAARWFPRAALPPDLGRYVDPVLARARQLGEHG